MKRLKKQIPLLFFSTIILSLFFTSLLSGQAASSLFPDITEFKLELPLDDNGNDYEGVSYNDRDDPHIKNAVVENLGGYVASSPYNQYFFVSGNELVMRAHCAGALTSINAYPRCELRQQIGGENTFWDYSDEHELNVTLKITEVPDEKREVCVVQAKGTNTPSTTSGTKEVLRVEYRADGNSGWHLEVNEDGGPSNILNYSLGQTVHIRVYVNNDNVTLEMENLDNGDTYNLQFGSDFSHGYFKTGAYTQSSIWEDKNGVADEDADARSEVRFSQIELGEPNSGQSCTPLPPGNRNVSNVGQSSATLSWASVPNAENYDLRYKPTNSSTWAYNTNYENTSITISGLSNNTQYQWQVKSACPDGSDTNYSQGPGPNFTTGGGSGNTFTPDPNKKYHINVPHHNLRLAATGSSENAYTTSTSTTGSDVEWKFVAKGNGYWHVQRAAGGSKPRLRTDNSINADMQATSSSGSYTYYEFTEGSSSGTWYMTLPDGPTNHKRLQVNNSGAVRFLSTNSAGTWESFTFTEATSGGGCSSSVPSNRQVNSVTNSSATVSWNSTGADNYDVRYKKVADSDWKYKNNNTGSSTTITGVVESTTYEWQLRGQCIGGSSSSWSSGQGPNFTTANNFSRRKRSSFSTRNNTSDDSSLQQEASIYPNPAVDQITITGIVDGESIQILNVNGQVVIETKDKTVSILNLQKGIYFVRCQNRAAIRFIKL